jgi:hypothetical protein
VISLQLVSGESREQLFDAETRRWKLGRWMGKRAGEERSGANQIGDN